MEMVLNRRAYLGQTERREGLMRAAFRTVEWLRLKLIPVYAAPDCMRLPDGVPVSRVSAAEMRRRAEDTRDAELLAALFAAVCNRTFYEVNVLRDLLHDPEVYRAVQADAEEWRTLRREMKDRILRLAEARADSSEESGTSAYRVLAVFLAEYGYVLSGYWWVRADDR